MDNKRALMLLVVTILIVKQCMACCQSSCSTCTTSCHKCCDDCKTNSSQPPPINPPSVNPTNNAMSQNANHTVAVENNVNLTNIVNNNNVINFTISLTSTNINNMKSEGCCQDTEKVIIPVTLKPPIIISTPKPCRQEECPTAPKPCETTSKPCENKADPCPTAPTPCKTRSQPCQPKPCPDESCENTCEEPAPAPARCCVMVVPCVTQNCNQYRYGCGSQCYDRVSYVPQNPCSQGCQRRNTWSCNNYCSEDFYKSYSSYRSCKGCFTN